MPHKLVDEGLPGDFVDEFFLPVNERPVPATEEELDEEEQKLADLKQDLAGMEAAKAAAVVERAKLQ